MSVRVRFLQEVPDHIGRSTDNGAWVTVTIPAGAERPAVIKEGGIVQVMMNRGKHVFAFVSDDPAIVLLGAPVNIEEAVLASC